MTIHEPRRVAVPFFTYGTLVLLGFIAVGYSFGLTRLITGLGTVTNLDNHNPWGIWIAFDVACGVALAAGGFTTAALVEIFGRRRYRALLRPALLTALLGYLWVAVALMFDLGRYWNIWRPIFHWQGNSVLFEVAMCVMFYLVVLGIEMSPAVLEGLQERMAGRTRLGVFLKRLERPVAVLSSWVRAALPLFIVAGVVLSFMHQSSLGTLMLIAPSKMSPLWYTSILPVLFLLSAIMVGFPMVILESIIASVSFNRDPEMDLLTPLARKIPWFIAFYGGLKIIDLAVRWKTLPLAAEPGPTITLAVEILMGVVAPFILLLIRAVRRSVGWLFFAVILLIFGVVVNRINVFLVGYNPPYMQKGYFPSLGEISLTIAIICSIMFVYRFFVIYFPVLPGLRQPPEPPTREEPPVKPILTWVFRGSAAAFLLLFVFLYTVVHRQAIGTARAIYRPVPPAPVTGKASQVDDAFFRHSGRPGGYRNLYILNHPFLNARNDDYGPVRFSHRSHDVDAGSDCSVCHHRVAMGADDRIGEDLGEMHRGIDVRIGGACVNCHADLAQKTFNRCDQCHRYANEPDDPTRIGLKGAFHRQCIGCHQRRATAAAPVACDSCHYRNVPDHRALVQAVLPLTADPRAMTAECLRCHERSGRDILTTAHWNWRGPSPTLSGREHRIDVGLWNIVDNYTVTARPELTDSARFHVGYGLHGAGFDFSDPHGIDCLVCHDTGRLYRKSPGSGGRPAPGTDLTAVARRVGRPGRANCGSCHFYAGPAANTRYGDLEPGLADNAGENDVHMGPADMRCQDCHTTTAHRIAGLSFQAPVSEGRVSCGQCHGEAPHGISGPLARHLDDHVRSVACETCHIPDFARTWPTLVESDLSAPTAVGGDLPADPGAEYRRLPGRTVWRQHVVPVYRWFDGSRGSHLLGDPITPGGVVALNPPLGERFDPRARIHPFKVHRAVQPLDSGNNVLTPLLWPWPGGDVRAAAAAGMKAVGLPFSGTIGFVTTEMYGAIRHGVVPARRALGCTDCHEPQAVSCTRCHSRAAGMELPAHIRPVYPQVRGRIDFKALGYMDDPARVGGRFFRLLGRGKPTQ